MLEGERSVRNDLSPCILVIYVEIFSILRVRVFELAGILFAFELNVQPVHFPFRWTLCRFVVRILRVSAKIFLGEKTRIDTHLLWIIFVHLALRVNERVAWAELRLSIVEAINLGVHATTVNIRSLKRGNAYEGFFQLPFGLSDIH